MDGMPNFFSPVLFLILVSTYSALTCSECKSFVGRVYKTTSRECDHLRFVSFFPLLPGLTLHDQQRCVYIGYESISEL